jgi:hypothetical protein
MAEKVVIEKKDIGTIPTGIVQATGTAGGTKHGKNPELGRRIEAAMSDAVHAISHVCDEVWADPKLTAEQKKQKIAVLSDPDNVRALKLKAREQAKARYARELEQAAKAAAEAEEKAKEKKSAQ